MNPFTFKENESADPAIYADFCQFMADKKMISKTAMNWL
jgi:hypothetical protein